MKLYEGKDVTMEASFHRTPGGPVPEFHGYTGFSENFQTMIGQTIDEEHSTSSLYDPDKAIHNPFESFEEAGNFLSELGENKTTRRTKFMQGLIDSGELSPDLKDAFTKMIPRSGSQVDWNAMAEHINENDLYKDELPTDEMMDADTKATLADRRAYANDIYQRQNTSGFWGSMAGGATAGAIDPMAIVTMGVSVPALGAVTTSKVLQAAFTASKVAAINAGVQGVLIEPFIHEWKDEIGAEYTWKESAINMTAAGLLSGSVSFAGSNIGIYMRSKGIGEPGNGSNFESTDVVELTKDFESMGMKTEDAEAVAQYQAELNAQPDRDMPASQHMEEIEAKQETMYNEGPEQGDVEPDIDANESAPIDNMGAEDQADIGTRIDETTEQAPEFEPTDTAPMKKADIIQELNEKHGRTLDENPKAYTKEDLNNQLEQAERTAHEEANLTPEQRLAKQGETIITQKFNKLVEEGREVYIDGRKVPLSEFTRADVEMRTEILDSIICLAGG